MDFSSPTSDAAVMKEAFVTSLAVTQFMTQQTPVAEELKENRCVVCQTNMRETNQRQLCWKTRCANEEFINEAPYVISDDDDDYDVDEHKPTFKFMSIYEFETMWSENLSTMEYTSMRINISC